MGGNCVDRIERFTDDEQKLLVETLLSQNYVIELLSSELNDIESGIKAKDEHSYQQLKSLYDRLRIK